MKIEKGGSSEKTIGQIQYGEPFKWEDGYYMALKILDDENNIVKIVNLETASVLNAGLSVRVKPIDYTFIVKD